MKAKHNKTSLAEMLKDLKSASRIYHPSRFWMELNMEHNEQLSDSGLENFKRSINGKYFGFGWNIFGIIIHEFFPFLHSFVRGNFKPFISGRFRNYNLNLKGNVKKFNNITAFFYKVYVCNLFDYVSRLDKLNIFKKIKEPSIGNPFLIEYKGRVLSQDLCNSIHEFYSAIKSRKLTGIKNIAEIGAGYGRLAYIFLKIIPNATYTIIDIPPALFVSQWYLSRVFHKEKIFFYRRFKSYKKIKKEFESSRVRFLMADQIELLPKKSFDLMINVSSLHEMKRNQIKNFIKQIDRLTKGTCYIKEWYRSMTKDNHWITQKEYPIPSEWEIISSRFPHPIQTWFFDTLYRLY